MNRLNSVATRMGPDLRDAIEAMPGSAAPISARLPRLENVNAKPALREGLTLGFFGSLGI